jgi:oligopeptidase B
LHEWRSSIIQGIMIKPFAEKIPTIRTFHGETLHDDYAWLRAEQWQEVLRNPRKLPPAIKAYLKAENAHFKTAFKPLQPLCVELKREMRARMNERDESVPIKNGDYLYYTRFEEGKEQPAFYRSFKGTEELILDGNKQAEGLSFFDIGAVTPSPDHARIAWSADVSGNELYTINVGDDRVHDTTGDLVWGADSASYYYIRLDEEHRGNRIFLHILGENTDKLIYEEYDKAFFLSIERSADGSYMFITASESERSEVHAVDLYTHSTPRLLLSRDIGYEFSADYHPLLKAFVIETNFGAEDYALKHLNPDLTWGVDFIAGQTGRMVEDFILTRAFLITLFTENALPYIEITALQTGETHRLTFDEPAFTLSLEAGEEFDTSLLRFVYSSPKTPDEVWDYDMATRERILKKRHTVPSGHASDDYIVERITAGDIPITLLRHKDTQLPAPLFLESYGAYGISYPADFESDRLSLVNRGMVFAIAHVRGGTEKGRAWYLAGKLEHKENTFKDTISAAEHLISESITTKGAITFHGGSAGGMLAGAIANLAPALFKAIIARVPFVDVLNTMLDESLPLTPPEWTEWGNPIIDKVVYDRLKAYSPYENITAKEYPAMLVLAGLTDPRVTYWEPAKYVAKLRAHKTNDTPLLFHTNLDAGHSGSSGRFERLDEQARIYGFALSLNQEKP